MRPCPLILNLDQRVVDIEALYRSTDGANTWIPVNGITDRRDAISATCRDLYTFEFEFEFCRRDIRHGGKAN